MRISRTNQDMGVKKWEEIIRRIEAGDYPQWMGAIGFDFGWEDLKINVRNNCGYCLELFPNCGDCILKDFCNGPKSPLYKMESETEGNDNPRWKLVLRWSNQILDAIKANEKNVYDD